MFDIDKMFLMIPSFKKGLNLRQKSKLHDYIYEKTKGKIIRESLSNLLKLVKNLDLDLDLGSTENLKKEDVLKEYKKLKSKIIESIMDSSNLNNENVSEFLKESESKNSKNENVFNKNSKNEISELYKSNEELSKIGTLEEYYDYLSTIFPESEVRDVIYHGTGRSFDSFDDSLLGSNTNALSSNLGHFFTNNRELSELYSAYNGAASKFEMTDDIKGKLVSFVKSLNEKTVEGIGDNLRELNKEVFDYIFDVTFEMSSSLNELEGQKVLDDPKMEEVRLKYQAARDIEERLKMLNGYIQELKEINDKNLTDGELSSEIDKFMKIPVPMLLQKAKPIGDLMMSFSLTIGKDIIPNLAPGKKGIDAQFDRDYEQQKNTHKKIAYGKLVYKNGERLDPNAGLSEGVVKYGYDDGVITKSTYFVNDSGMLDQNKIDILEKDIADEIPQSDLKEVEEYYDRALSKITEEYNENKSRVSSPDVKLALLNMVNPSVNDDKRSMLHTSKMTDRFIENSNEDNDSHILKNTFDPYLNDVHIVKSSDQINVLGSNADINGFKNYKNDIQSQKKSNYQLNYENKEGTDGYYSNKLIETYKHILTDPEILKEVMQSIDSSFFKDVISAITPKNKSASMSLYHMEPKNEIETSFSFREGKAGVGIEANSMVDVNRKGEIKSTDETSDLLSHFLHEFNTEGETILFDKEFSRPLEISEITDFAKKIGIKDINTFVEEVKNVKTMASFVAVLNGFVDIAKDSYITQGGWGTASTNFGNTLLRMGMNPLKVITLMMQPAIRYRFTKGFDYKEELMKLIEERGVEKEEEDLTTLSEDIFNLDTLVDDINGNSKGLLSRQIAIDAFADIISKITKDLKINIEVSRLDTDGSNGDISNMHVVNNKIEEFKKSRYITGIDSKFENTVLSIFKNNLDEMFKVTQSNPHLFPESSKYHLAVVDYISKLLSGKPVLSTDVLNEINSSLYAAKMQKFFDLDYAKTVNLLKNFPEEFNKFKDLHKEDYLILKELSVKTAVSQNLKNVNALINLNSRVRTGVEKAKIRNSWGDLYKKHPEFAEKLAKYAYASTNFKFTPTQFYEYIPSSYYISKDITKFVKEYNHKNISIIGVLNDLVKGSVETSKLVPYVAKKSMKVFKGVGMVNVKALTSDRPHIIKGSNNTLLFVDTFGEIRKTKDGVFAPFYKIDQITKTLDGVNISVFEEFAPNSEELNNALVNYFNNNDTGITESLLKQSSFTPQELGELDSLFDGFKKNITENFSRKSILEEYRNKLNTKMSAAEVNILLSSLYYSDLSIAEIKQELENCI